MSLMLAKNTGLLLKNSGVRYQKYSVGFVREIFKSVWYRGIKIKRFISRYSNFFPPIHPVINKRDIAIPRLDANFGITLKFPVPEFLATLNRHDSNKKIPLADSRRGIRVNRKSFFNLK